MTDSSLPGDSLYFRQIKAGPMENFVYAIGSMNTRECVLVDPAWDVPGLLETLDNDGMTLTGALITHYHPDHCGGSMFGFTVPGLPQLMTERPVPVYVNRHEAAGIKQVTGLSDSDLRLQDSGDSLVVGDLEVTFVHTPGHTPGSQCFLVNRRLVAGDTLFIDGCGRVDLPGGNQEQLWRSLALLGKMPDDTVLFPGHHYSHAPSASMGHVKAHNSVLKQAIAAFVQKQEG